MRLPWRLILVLGASFSGNPQSSQAQSGQSVDIAAAPLASVVHLTLNAAQLLRTVDDRLFGVNTAIWDSVFDTTNTSGLLREMDNRVLRFPGGSISDEYHWASNRSGTNTWTWATSFSHFAHIATNTGAQVILTVNYGSGTPQEAAAWVRHSNVTNHYGFKYWEIGNENYGSWETDTNPAPNDPFTYATRAKDYVTQMKAGDPSIRIGVVVMTGENSYANYNNHPALNPRTGQTHFGWTPVLLSTLKSLGVTPDYVIYHRYDQAPGAENDQTLLQSSRTWSSDASDLRQQLRDYLGPANSNVEIVCTENNSVYTTPGKQSTSLVNGLFLADSFGQILQTEINGLVWWDLRNGQETGNNNSPSLYGWRLYGDYGIVSSAHERYPAYYTAKLLKYFARGGDTVIRASSDYTLLAAYAARRTNGTLSALVINKSPSNSLDARLTVNGYRPDTNATIFRYGIAQDEAARTGVGSPDLLTTNITFAGTNFIVSFPPYSATVISFRPEAPRLWAPLPAMQADGFHFQVQGQTGLRYVVETSTNLAIWSRLGTNYLTNDLYNFIDPQATNRPRRFYRSAWWP